MDEINCSVAIIRPKRPYITWANSLPDADRELTDDAFQKVSTAILIDEYETQVEARALINNIWENIFEYELDAWCTNEAWWPQERTQKMFWQWFDVEFHSIAFESGKAPIKRV